MDFTHTLLPAAFSICASLGIARPDCNAWTIQGTYQTDKSLWYIGSASRPDSSGPPSESECRGATPVETYDIDGGGKGTVYACLAPLADDTITPAELKAIADLSARLNSISLKTLEDHQRALAIKGLVAELGGKP
jgi:hypothetical protein